MKQRNRTILRRLMVWLTVLSLLLGTGISGAFADPTEGGTTVDGTGEEGTLTPPDYSYEDGNVILHKQAVRTGPTEWTINVKVTIGAKPVEKRQMEVVFLLDTSLSMIQNTAHVHTDACSLVVCPVHTDHSLNCYELECTQTEHTHTDDCCSTPEHQHVESYETGGCYLEECDLHTTNNQHNNAGCVQFRVDRERVWYKLTCGMEEHTHSADCDDQCSDGLAEHTHDSSCYGDTPICGVTENDTTHVHGLGCYKCPYYVPSDHDMAEYYINGDDASRMAVAVVAAERLIASLPADSTIVTRLAFNTDFYDGISSYYDVTNARGTYMWNAINETLTGGFFSDDENTKKVFVIITDGAATDSGNPEDLDPFKEAGGTVFTVGFGYDGTELAEIAGGDGGYYMNATDASSLELAFDSIAQTLTAMLEDPMGNSVDFDIQDGIQEIQTANGVITQNGETIYWNPAEGTTGTIANSTIEFSYTVNLSESADQTVGEHNDVALNETTYFYYGYNDVMKAVEFPIPEADYAYSSITTSWVDENGTAIDLDDLLAAAAIADDITIPDNPTDVEKVVSDYQSATYIPHYEQSYDFMPAVIPISGSNDYYRYVRTEVIATSYSTDADGNSTSTTTTLSGVEDVDATNPVAHVVKHIYELVEADELYVGGTKIMNGRDFDANGGDTFTFTLTGIADADGNLPPMPSVLSNGAVRTDNVVTLTINPTSGNTQTFEFGMIEFSAAGTYTYEIVEQKGNLEGVIYDTAVRKMVVTVTKDGTDLVATPVYTVNGATVSGVTITNSLETGALKVEKTGVDSYNEEHQNTEFTFLINARNVSNRALSGAYEVEYTYADGSTATGTVTFVNGIAQVKLKAKESVVINGLPDGATYTITEDTSATPGFVATATGDTGTIVAGETQTASFANKYVAKGTYQFIGKKTLEDAALENYTFSFVVEDENGEEVTTGLNVKDGTVFFVEIPLTHEDIGTKTYYIREVNDSQSGILYDRTVYEVTLTITDNGDGTLNIVSDTPNSALNFANKYITGQLTISKTVTGNMGNRYTQFPFTLTAAELANQTINVSTDGGVTFNEVTLNDQGVYEFTLMHGQDIIFYPVSGEYTVTETANGSYTTSYSLDGGDATTGTSWTVTLSDSGDTVEFVNDLNVGVPTGVDTPTSAALVGIVVAMALLAIVYIGRRWRILEE